MELERSGGKRKCKIDVRGRDMERGFFGIPGEIYKRKENGGVGNSSWDVSVPSIFS